MIESMYVRFAFAPSDEPVERVERQLFRMMEVAMLTRWFAIASFLVSNQSVKDFSVRNSG